MNKYEEKELEILKNLTGVRAEIESIQLYLKNIYAVKRFSFGTWTSRQHVIIAIKAGDFRGYAESIITINQPEVSLDGWKKCSGSLTGLSVSDALTQNRRMRSVWQEQFVEMTEMALIDLIGKLKNVPALSLLGLSEKKAPYGVHVILSDDMEEVEASVKWAQKAEKTAYIKVKLFGNNKLDCDVIRTVRKVCKRERTYLIGDVNCGYRPEGKAGSVQEIAEHLERLYEAGLDACEDPAFLDIDEWITLQTMTAPLCLIPDYPMRPSRGSIHTIKEGMGDIYNIHPDSAGSLIDAVVLAHKIRDIGAGLMIGDDSLVAASASIWQQIACGLEADWVEAVEKKEESDFYYRCVKSLATDSRKNPITIHLQPGFGIELDEAILKAECDQMTEVSYE